MKILYSIMISFLPIVAINAQDGPNTYGHRWEDEVYLKKNQPVLKAVLDMQYDRWNQMGEYLITGAGDTIRPYTIADWRRDSINLYNRNWDDPNAAWPESISKVNVYNPNKNYKIDSAKSNKAGRSKDVKIEGVPGESKSLKKDDINHHTGNDFAFMKNNQLMVEKSGIESKVLGYITLPSGVRIIENGNIILNDGTTMHLNPGERIDLFEKNFRIIPAAQ